MATLALKTLASTANRWRQVFFRAANGGSSLRTIILLLAGLPGTAGRVDQPEASDSFTWVIDE